MGEALSAGQLKRLTEHKYSAEGSSMMEPTMQKFWRWLVEQIPLTWAPNSITLVGLTVNVLTTLILVVYSPDARHEEPAWGIVACAVGLFAYQSLDAIDGKQARRTSTSSPLGELFDHGCDGLSTVFVMMGVCLALQMGMYPGWLFLECFLAMVTYYGAHWQTYCTGTLKFGTLDVTEAQFLVISIYMASALFGSTFWEYHLPLVGLELRFIPVLISLMGMFVTCQSNFSIIFIQGGVGKSGSTVAGTSVLSPMLPMGLMVALAVTIWQKSPSHVYENHPVLYVLTFGMAAAKITNKLVIAHMTKSEMDKFDSSLIGPLLLFLNQYFNTPFSEYFVLWVAFFYCTVDLIRYSAQVCSQICEYLNIYCFKITPPSKCKSTDSVPSGTGKQKSAVFPHNNGTNSSSSRQGSKGSKK